MTELNGEAHHIKLYNLPQGVEGGIKVSGYDMGIVGGDRSIVIRFHNLDALSVMTAICTIDGSENIIKVPSDTSIVELGNDEYQIDEPEVDEDKSY